MARAIRLSSGRYLYVPNVAASSGRAAATPWYLAGGCPAPIAVWQPKAGNGWTPADIAGSYVNLVNPGTYNAAPGTAPAFDPLVGWTFTAASSQFLTTGVVPAGTGYSLLIRYNSATWAAALRTLAGGLDVSGYGMAISSSNASHFYGNQNYSTVAGAAPASGTICVAGQQGYLNGVADGAAITTAATTWKQLYLGALNNNGATTYYCTAVVTAVAVWSSNVAAYMAAVHAALVAAGL